MTTAEQLKVEEFLRRFVALEDQLKLLQERKRSVDPGTHAYNAYEIKIAIHSECLKMVQMMNSFIRDIEAYGLGLHAKFQSLPRDSEQKTSVQNNYERLRNIQSPRLFLLREQFKTFVRQCAIILPKAPF
jgi:hypothetical protein